MIITQSARAVVSRTALLCVLLAASASAAPVELSAAILTLGTFDYLRYPNGTTSRCTDMVERARNRAGGTTLAFVPTIFWLSNAKNKMTVDGYCYMDGIDGSPDCLPVTQDLISQFQQGLRACLKFAVDRGFKEVAVVPHLDEATYNAAAWRNAIVFDPLAKYRGFTYEEALLNPFIDALNSVVKGRAVTVHITLQVRSGESDKGSGWGGEMSATVLRYPGQWAQLANRVRDKLKKAGGLSDQQIQMGISYNYNKVDLGGLSAPGGGNNKVQASSGPSEDTTAISLPTASVAAVKESAAATSGGRRRLLAPTWVERWFPRLVSNSYPPANPAVTGIPRKDNDPSSAPASSSEKGSAGQLDIAALTRLISALDFIGISAYAAFTKVDFPLGELQNSAFTFFNEFKQTVGIDLDKVMKSKGITLHYSEYGMGGGTSMNGLSPAKSAKQASLFPFYGVFPSPYNSNKDPWTNPQVRDFMYSFWRKTLQWLAQGSGPTYPVSKCFLWTLGSYDVLGIYPESTSTQGSFYQPDLARAIAEHNKKAVSNRG